MLFGNGLTGQIDARSIFRKGLSVSPLVSDTLFTNLENAKRTQSLSLRYFDNFVRRNGYVSENSEYRYSAIYSNVFPFHHVPGKLRI